jgi:hypothetical protein
MYDDTVLLLILCEAIVQRHGAGWLRKYRTGGN